MTRDDCLDLLRQDEVGRVAVTYNGHALVFPVNYVLDSDDVIFRTAPGSKFTAAIRNRQAAFEIDHFDRSNQTGWSVLGSGWAEEITGAAKLDRVRQLPVTPWAPGPKAHWVRICLYHLSGRRISGTEA